MTRPLAVFRTDASQTIGAGHLRRCLALAGALERNGWRAGFLVGEAAAEIVPEILTGHRSIHTLPPEQVGNVEILARCWPEGCDCLVVDHYGLAKEFETAARSWAQRILVIDDLADRDHDCDLLLDSAPGRSAADYNNSVPQDCRLLLGPDYALLRPAFLAARPDALARRSTGPVKRILVMLGASNVGHHLAGLALDGIRKAELDVTVDFVFGAGSQGKAYLSEHAEAMPIAMNMHENPDDVAALMAGADIAIGAAGVSSWERCCLGLPTLLFVMAENQRKVADVLDAAGAVRLLGDASPNVDDVVAALAEMALDEAGRGAMAAAAAALCDGRGAARVMMEICADMVDSDGVPVRLRPATMADGEIMLAWQQHSQTRKYFREPAVPEADEHFAWLAGKLRDRRCLLNIILRGDAPAGVLRFDRCGKDDESIYDISIMVAPENQGRGVAKAALALGRIFLPGETFHAEVLPGNAASEALFRSAGFAREKDVFVARSNT